MYDEFERAVSGKSGERLSFLGWLSIAVGTLFALGIVAAGLTAVRAKSRVAEVVEEVQRQVEAHPTLAAEAMLERLESHASLLSVPPDRGVTLLQDLGDGAPGDAFMKEFFGGTLEIFPEGPQIVEDLKNQVRESLLEIKSAEGNVRMDLIGGEDGGALVIDSDGGQVRFDLRKTEDGGFLTIDSDEGQVRFDVIKGDNGGSLVINSKEGEVRFDVTGGDEGGSLVIRSEEGTLRFGAGLDAEAMPGWVPRVEGMPVDPEALYSLTSREGFMGAVAWEGDGSAREIFSFYRDWLEGEAYEFRAQQRTRDGGAEVSSLWARNDADGRVVFLVASQENDLTGILLGYGEKR